MKNLHTELYPELAGVVGHVHGTDVNLAHTLAHFVAEVSPKLNPEERAELASILHQTVALVVAHDSADHVKHGTEQPRSTAPNGSTDTHQAAAHDQGAAGPPTTTHGGTQPPTVRSALRSI